MKDLTIGKLRGLQQIATPDGLLTMTAMDHRGSLQKMLNREHQITVVFVTHERDIARHTRRIIHLRDGRITQDESVDEPLLAEQVIEGMAVGNGKWPPNGNAVEAGA